MDYNTQKLKELEQQSRGATYWNNIVIFWKHWRGLVWVIMVATALVCGVRSCTQSNPNFEYTVEANVLSVNTNILHGRLIGAFLSGSSGQISNDINKIGVSFYYYPGDMVRLEDLEVAHAVLAHYANAKTIKLNLKLTRLQLQSDSYTLTVRFHGNVLARWRLTTGLGESIMKNITN